MQRGQSRLIAGMYDRPHVNLFGLRGSQVVDSPSVVTDGGWYNGLGERLGWGSLSMKQLFVIARELRDPEQFIVLASQHAYHALRQHPVRQRFPTNSGASIDMDNPGVDYVVTHALWIILPGSIYCVLRADYPEPEFDNPTPYTRITPAQVADTIRERTSVAGHVHASG